MTPETTAKLDKAAKELDVTREWLIEAICIVITPDKKLLEFLIDIYKNKGILKEKEIKDVSRNISK